MRTRLAVVPAVAALAAVVLTATPSDAHSARTTLIGRAGIPATDYQPGPVSGTALDPATVNGVTPPFDGQPIPGFSAAITGRHRGQLLAMPDNGFGAKTNSADFLLRAYYVTPRYRTGPSTSSALAPVSIDGFVSFRDPDHKIPFPIVNESTKDRLLTGADFDIESLQRDAAGNLWIGDEFGPFLVEVDKTGKVLQAPVPLADGTKSPQSPYLKTGETPSVNASSGFEAMAISTDGRTLYPILEGAKVAETDKTRRTVYEFDIRKNSYTGKTWTISVDDPAFSVADAQVLDGRRIAWLERDNFEGAEAKVKQIKVAELGKPGPVASKTVADLLKIADPRGITTPARTGEFGVGPTYSFPLQSVETILPLGGDRVFVTNDNNFPGNDGRIAGKADDIELIEIVVPGLRKR
ncbi:esterase-like activity of phytase family protein [Cryptosporangium phraense]|uniref:esterase-like activity of phytase family protein n=1 Tax=Cryptosporangium phraense TaxID=2593070 RepID=UPI00197A74C9|nr:esterase-like activity of phytase family protein [Cryptosporangium phraense]